MAYNIPEFVFEIRNTKAGAKFDLANRANFSIYFLDLMVMFGQLAAGILYMSLRSIFNESFLQEEWVHTQA
jgi:hypothetical protein